MCCTDSGLLRVPLVGSRVCVTAYVTHLSYRTTLCSGPQTLVIMMTTQLSTYTGCILLIGTLLLATVLADDIDLSKLPKKGELSFVIFLLKKTLFFA